jgi:hypothetical protein
MEDLLKRLIKELVGIAVWEAVRSLALGIAVFILGYAGFYLNFKDYADFSRYKFSLLILFGMLGVLSTVWGYRYLTRCYPRFDKIKSDVRLLNKTIIYDYRDPGCIFYKRRYQIKLLKHGVEKLVDRYRWSGIHDAKPVVSDRSGCSIKNLQDGGLYNFFEIGWIGNKKNSVINVELTWTLNDLEKLSNPIVSATIYEPTDELVIEIHLPEYQGVSSVWRKIAPDAGSLDSTKEPEIFANAADGVHIWRIKKPRLLHYYEVFWKPIVK